MKAKKANSAQRKWMEDITEWSICNVGLLYGSEWDGAIPQRHHVLGRSARQNKVDIGHWFILPVPFELHDVSSNHPLNVTHHKKAFIAEFGTQRSLFNKMYQSMLEQGYSVPDVYILFAIMDTNA